jgi:nucleotide-binding universal stress UspA family protein
MSLATSVGMKPTIMVPFDFSDTVERALAWAADLQASTGGPAIEMVHAVDARPLGTAELQINPVLPDEDETKRLEQVMRDAAARHHARANVQVVVRASEVQRILVEAAHELHADLLVMGTHGLSGVRRLLLGSVAEHIVRHADCPVVTVRTRADPHD